VTGAALLLCCGGRASACRDDALVREFQQSGDDFRAVTVLRGRELERRGTAPGFECSRMILGTYLRHAELDLADDWVARMARDYAALLAPGQALRLEVEVAYLIGNSAEVRRRAAQIRAPAVDRLIAFADAADAPFSFDARQAPTCAEPACAGFRRILDARPRLPHKSPGLALMLGLVPGLGQIYAGRPLAGVGSFLLNGFLLGTTAFGVTRHEYALAALSGAIALGFYSGNLYAGYEAATRFNEHQAQTVREEIRALPVDLELNKLAL
jgi:TM2 domain-containing membrane protein YozV